MGFHKKTIKDIDLSGKTVLLRADYNVPLEGGKITSDYRIEQSLATVKYLIEQNCKVVICSHLGRPKDANDSQYSLKPVAKRLGELLGQDVQFLEACVGDTVKRAVKELEHGSVLLLENLRFHPEEEANDEAFGKQLVEWADVFVQDAFGVVHRAHASTDVAAQNSFGVAGLLLENEIKTITSAIETPQRPLVTIIGGAKISDKIGILKRFVEIADVVAVGGAMANTFLLAKGIDVGESMVEEDDVDIAKEIMERAKERSAKEDFVFYVPQDGVVAREIDAKTKTRIVDWDAHVIADIESYPKRVSKSSTTIENGEMILDIGPFSGAFIAGCLQLAETVIWNGGMGITEQKGLQGPIGPFAHGTDLIMDAMLGVHGNKPYTLVGGGDTVGFVESEGLLKSFGHVSTGGGASLELMSGKLLPGVEALEDKDG
ncbi:MAG: phosphoglycerate kinase [Candidatus Saccharibacteria bacterium]|nr:phosphoglycerate kinase [Candidatus Saccharibacteria bacterium]